VGWSPGTSGNCKRRWTRLRWENDWTRYFTINKRQRRTSTKAKTGRLHATDVKRFSTTKNKKKGMPIFTLCKKGLESQKNKRNSKWGYSGSKTNEPNRIEPTESEKHRDKSRSATCFRNKSRRRWLLSISSLVQLANVLSRRRKSKLNSCRCGQSSWRNVTSPSLLGARTHSGSENRLMRSSSKSSKRMRKRVNSCYARSIEKFFKCTTSTKRTRKKPLTSLNSV
jgi:hypothetical protein